MTPDELRALIGQGPCVVMMAREDALALLDRVEAAEKARDNWQHLTQQLQRQYCPPPEGDDA